jgi:hypothetical protein
VSVHDATWSTRLTKNWEDEVTCPRDLPSMINASRSAASQLAAVSVVACMSAACPTALAQTSSRALDPHALERGADAAGRQGGGVAQGVRAHRACIRLFDGRGERVLVRRPGGEAGASVSPDCPADTTQRRPTGGNRQAKAVEPSLEVLPITAGSAQVDHASSRDRGASTPIAPRISTGRLSATLVTGGTAMFLLHSSLWTYLLILGLPFWQHVDLLPIVDAATDGEGATGDTAPDADEERAVTRVLDAGGSQRDSAGAGRG